MEQFKPYTQRLDKELSKFPKLVSLEQRVKIPKVYLTLGAAGFGLLLLLVQWTASFFSGLIGLVYPAYASFHAIESPDTNDDKQWLTYWVVFACFSVLEPFADYLVFWFPFYYMLKAVVLVYLFSPYTRGAEVVYTRFVRPAVFASEVEVSRFASKTLCKKSASSEVEEIKNLVDAELRKAH